MQRLLIAMGTTAVLGIIGATAWTLRPHRAHQPPPARASPAPVPAAQDHPPTPEMPLLVIEHPLIVPDEPTAETAGQASLESSTAVGPTGGERAEATSEMGGATLRRARGGSKRRSVTTVGSPDEKPAGREVARAHGELGSAGAFSAIGGTARRSLPASAMPAEREPALGAPGGAFIACDAPGGDASTFAIDVDTASASNVRRLLRAGQRPPVEAVRIEEIINAFHYRYPTPGDDDPCPFRLVGSAAECSWEPNHRLVRVAVQGRELDRLSRPPLNVVFLVDTSGSMRDPAKLPLVKHGLGLLARQLDERDRLAVVTYAGTAGVALPAVPGSQHERIAAVIAGLEAGGSTNGSGGIHAAYAEALLDAGPGIESRVVLCTDGDFNVGTTDLAELTALITAKRASGVRLSVFGFGAGDFRDRTLEALADHGDGVYGYIGDERQAERLLADEALAQLVTIAKDVKIQVFFNPAAVAGWRLIGYRNRLLRRQDFNDDAVDGSEIGSGHRVTALYEVVPAGRPIPGGVDPNPFIAAAPPEPAALAPDVLLRVRMRWQPPAGGGSSLIEADVPAAARAMDADFRLAAAAAAYGMLLDGSAHTRGCSWAQVRALAAGMTSSVPS